MGIPADADVPAPSIHISFWLRIENRLAKSSGDTSGGLDEALILIGGVQGPAQVWVGDFTFVVPRTNPRGLRRIGCGF